MYEEDHTVIPDALLPNAEGPALPNDFNDDQLTPYYERAWRDALRAGCTCQPDIMLGLAVCPDTGDTTVAKVDVYHDEDCGVMLLQIARFN